ncbi:MAG: response regulator transcription factor [Clostridiales bacterium]|nr:response regulator transcription factor [Clostridiales bacterium]OPZ66873.1 MAG: putative response regulatory protein [Firmicutes bacterium ADurb.Bin467]
MYKVFLVDDEIVIREGIRNNFPWEGSDFSLAGEAPDGEIALQMMQDVKPDILITDIRMPFMDGMQLCEAVSHTMPWVQIVILSGYDDFSYAQQAISLGVKEYLLKPVSAQELLEVLERIGARIREERRQQADLLRIKRQFASNSGFLKEKLLVEALNGAKSAEAATRMLERARGLNFSLLAKRYLVILARARGGEEGRALAQSILYRLADGSGDAVHACEAPGGFALIVMGDSDDDLEERAYGFSQAALYEIERASGTTAQMCIGEAVGDFSELPRSYQSAQMVRRAMDESPDKEKRRIMGARDVGMQPMDALINLDVLPLSERLQYANREDVEKILNEYIHSMGSAAIHSVMMVNFLYVEILMAASRIIKESGGEPREVIDEEMWEQSLFSTMHDPQEVIPVAKEVLEKAIAFREQQSSTRYNGTINKARAYLAREYQNSGVTLNDVASHVCMSNSHFCTIFSQEVGVTFTEYLTNLRMSRAKELLRTTKLRSSDIAYAVGYNDPHYFSYLFKKHTGLTPRDYRKESSERM